MRPNFKNSPLDSAIVSALGGIVILYVGFTGLLIVLSSGNFSAADLSEVIAGTLWGLLIIAISLALPFDVKRHRAYGIGLMILSVASWYGTSGGLFFGSAVVFISGIMAYIWKPKTAVGPANQAGTSEDLKS